MSDFPREVQSTIEDLSFHGCKLFACSTDASLPTLKNLRAMLRSLGICTPVNKRRFSRFYTAQKAFLVSCSTYHSPSESPAKRPRYSKKKLSSATTSSQTPMSSKRLFWWLVKILNHPADGTLQLQYPDPLPPFGCLTSHFQDAGEHTTPDEWVLEFITSGYTIHFKVIPPIHLQEPF